MKLAEMRVLIVGGNNTAGPLPDLARYLGEGGRAREVSFIGHPFAQDIVRRSQLLRWNRGRSAVEATVERERHSGALSYLLDLALTLHFLVRLRRRYDLYVSGTPHFGLLGLLLRRLGVVKGTTFWTHDYHPRRFRNPLLNRLYLGLDRLLAETSDWLWDVVPTITEHRRQRGVWLGADRVLTVGDPLEAREICCLPAEEVPAGAVLFSGLVDDGYGFDLLLEAMPLVASRRPDARVTVTTYQPFPETLRRGIRERGLEDRFDLLGFIANDDEYSRVIQRHRIGLAIYEPRPGSHKRYSDSRAKTYMARGGPVITTSLPPIAAEIESAGAGIVVDYSKEALAGAITDLLCDDDLYRRCRASALALAQGYTAERVFQAAFRRMGIEFEDRT